MTIFSRVILLLTAASLLTSTTIEARRIKHVAAKKPPSCWTDTQVENAKIYELEIYLNVQTLRCREHMPELVEQYVTFVHDVEKLKFNSSREVRSKIGTAVDIDKYSIKLANKYGGYSNGLTCADIAGLLQNGLKNDRSREGLLQTAALAKIDPLLINGAACHAAQVQPAVADPVKDNTAPYIPLPSADSAAPLQVLAPYPNPSAEPNMNTGVESPRPR